MSSTPSESSESASTDAVTEAFFALRHGLPRQGPGSDGTTRRLFRLAGPLPERPRVLDLGCGTGRSALLLAAEAGAHVTCVDLHQPFLDDLTAAAARRGLDARITTVNCSMDRPPFPDHAFDLVWAEGSAYLIGFDAALRGWRRLLAPGGALVVTEPEWSRADPCPAARAFWDAAYPLRTAAENAALAEAAGHRVVAHLPQPDSDWWAEFYDPLAERIAAADPDRPGTDRAVAGAREEIGLRREHGHEYRYAAYVLRPRSDARPRSETPFPHPNGTRMTGTDTPGTDTAGTDTAGTDTPAPPPGPPAPRPPRTSPPSVRSTSRPSPGPRRPTWSTRCARTPGPGSTACRWWPRPRTARSPRTPCSPAATSAAGPRSRSLLARCSPAPAPGRRLGRDPRRAGRRTGAGRTPRRRPRTPRLLPAVRLRARLALGHQRADGGAGRGADGPAAGRGRAGRVARARRRHPVRGRLRPLTGG
ncbi:class I SAM-dependent methyltransferase [Streptomyces sp. CA-132043]|uniref:class I SAM-dependent methyltransferase n=1 Tax=Streptomyces sp. CA-132043 TaxID=3240048 RepID=UPI003D8D2C76